MALTLFRIPLLNIAQRFEINLAGNDLILETQWDYLNTTWFVSIFDSITQDILLSSLPLVTGSNLVSQFNYLDFNFSLVVVSEGDILAVPTEDNLGTTSNLLVGVDQ